MNCDKHEIKSLTDNPIFTKLYLYTPINLNRLPTFFFHEIPILKGSVVERIKEFKFHAIIASSQDILLSNSNNHTTKSYDTQQIILITKPLFLIF